jgi:Domain of unknown function (DUF4198)
MTRSFARALTFAKAPAFARALTLGLAMATGGALSVQAHEFWFLPEDFTVDPGAQVRANLRIGSHMVGPDLPFLRANLPRYEVHLGDVVTPITARTGDIPAVNQAVEGTGLAVLVGETTDLLLTYEDFEKFRAFTQHKAMPWLVDQHLARGLPATGFSETFRRYAKSLVAIGDGVGSDRVMGLRIEIVALTNPYVDDMSQGMRLRVLMDGAPRVAAQLLLLATAADGTVTETPYVTDANGEATVTAVSGTTYLADSVDIFALPNDDVAAGPVWHSDWASLTYAVP